MGWLITNQPALSPLLLVSGGWMRKLELVFCGYTWDQYSYMIANRRGILIAYRGGLDSEGAVKLDEILYVDGAESLETLFESDQLCEIRKTLKHDEMLFFTYSEVIGELQNIVYTLNTKLKPLFPSVTINGVEIPISCKGACALFPELLLVKSS